MIKDIATIIVPIEVKGTKKPMVRVSYQKATIAAVRPARRAAQGAISACRHRSEDRWTTFLRTWLRATDKHPERASFSGDRKIEMISSCAHQPGRLRSRIHD